MVIIDGKVTSNKIRERIKEEHEKLSAEIGRKAGLSVILAGDSAASKIYVKNKPIYIFNNGYWTSKNWDIMKLEIQKIYE